MKLNIHILSICIGLLLSPITMVAQNVDFNKRPDDDLGNVEDKFQEYFFEALKQKGIENYQKSANALLKCIELDDSDPVLYFELGKNYKALKNFGAAENALKKAVSKSPENEWYLDELYDVYIQQGEMDKALKTVKQLVKFHPDYKQDLASLYIEVKKYKDALKLLDEMDAELGYNTDRDILRNKIYDLTGNDEDRIENLEERVRNNPENESNYLRLIFRYSETGETQKAFDAAKQLLEINPESQKVHLALYKFYLDANEVDNAITSMRIVLTSPVIEPEAKTKVLKDFVKFVANNPQYESDLVEVTALVSEDKSVKTLLELGAYYVKKEEKDKALNYYLEALQQEPNNFNIISDVLLLEIDLNKNSEAVKRSSDALELFPAQPFFYLINGVANNRLKQPKKAIESLELGLDFIVENPQMEGDFYKQLSESYKQVNNITQSEAFAKKAEAILKEQ
ncbi:tetratricopeptide repeat protein [Psychroserpens sp.]|uniref:tetratricopeptide repeat protein n=1 Tax=Psychroserpens sp. TaxID=2020870 RepID=UPI001B0348D6|nr:tetratricopeptide repeat protein [Psychroserpens sp.]MBO6605431.1 tetratricopeptide repeat protein [Psychroserpens sp.]MBO6630070.1 tetratricopeptide repeat protein [Psychroserpens sp.]MBO6653760.1 tetratricopeptide repeat protein [Psychroserpens sp.]MBO6682081.1 tetratricopeptide repeat protein [Psychroserpens sp.]MBO6748805.1 tetratricopeptide repeat protein [Psychroserpens sp.]